MVVMADEEEDDVAGGNRARWASRTEYLLQSVSMAIGLGNVWRFPKMVYDNGGAAFLIPYLLAALTLGLPLVIMEAGVGQRFQGGIVSVFSQISPRLRGIGFASMVAATIVSSYYVVIITWAWFYFFKSFTNQLPWSQKAMGMTDAIEQAMDQSSAEIYWDTKALKHVPLAAGGGQGGWDDINFSMLGLLFFSWFVIFLCIHRGIESSSKVAYFTALFPYLILTIFFFRGVTLPGEQYAPPRAALTPAPSSRCTHASGASIGLKFYLVCDSFLCTYAHAFGCHPLVLGFTALAHLGAHYISRTLDSRAPNHRLIISALSIPSKRQQQSVYAGLSAYS
jgi:SNF family Na+-dependent transporter